MKNSKTNYPQRTTTMFLAIILSFSCLIATAQITAPEIQWQNTIGGSSTDELYSIQQTADGGYILGGNSYSGNSGDKTEASLGYSDYWVVKLDAAGVIQWQSTIGGSEYDGLSAVQLTSDGGCILGGTSYSGISGDKSEPSLEGDYWVVKLDVTGDIQWQNTIGGSSYDYLKSIQQTSDGGYILGGPSYSGISGDKTEASQGDFDYWIVKLNSTGDLQWQNTIGGSSTDYLSSIQQTSDGGYILGGPSYSGISGDKTEASQGLGDYWVVKLDATGDIQWQNTIGGSSDDQLYSIQQTSYGGYILVGLSESGIGGDKTEECYGPYDYWVVKLDATGAIEWQNNIGGSGDEIPYSIQQTSDGGYILGGTSESGISGNKTEASLGGYDYWVVKLNSSGVIEWQNTIGGNDYDILYSIQQTSDGGYILGGGSSSGISGDKTQASQGLNDYWIVKVSADCNGGTTVYADNDGDGFGDISNGIFAVDCIAPDGYAYDSTDCDDANSEINPGVSEIINGLDDNCNGVIDEIVCNAPTGLETKDLTATSVKFKWGYSAASYKLRYKVATTGSWTLLGPTGQTKTEEGLLANTKYVWQVKSVCNVDPKIISEWSAKQFFTTAPFKVSTETEIPSLEVYPNPFSNSATISFSLPEASNVTIALYDIAGRKLQTILDQNLAAGNQEIVFQRGQLSSGLYLLQVKLGDTMEVRKLVVE
ncbi:MAG: T9SS type A sorting domain-containing protein [Chitinophagaceae bacterium]|nr:T9SS type A sorting domain-containing protein [Chitinophagaceae bacterium]